jgi:hypothetical protein
MKRKNIDICLLQETHSMVKDENTWKNQWGGNVIFCHGAHNVATPKVSVTPRRLCIGCGRDQH